MFVLPKDEKRKPILRPRVMFLWGAAMSGKTYWSSYWPHAIDLNTDDNAKQSSMPSIQLRNIRDANGQLKQSVLEQCDQVLNALAQPSSTYKTVVIDVVDDLVTMMTQAICLKNHVDDISQIPWGRGFATLKEVVQQFAINVTALPVDYVIFISREIESLSKSGIATPEPSLPTKWQNVFMGRADLQIRFQKNGAHYFRNVISKRADYQADAIQDKLVRRLLASCEGMFKAGKKGNN